MTGAFPLLIKVTLPALFSCSSSAVLVWQSYTKLYDPPFCRLPNWVAPIALS